MSMHTEQPTTWSLIDKIAFRFAFILITLFILIMNNGAFPLFNIIGKPILYVMHQFTPWFAQHILRHSYDYSIFTNGSGDTTYDWITLFILVAVAFLGCIVWTISDSKRKSYDTCYYWLTVVIRFYVAFMLMNYGVIKLVHGQMPPPSLSKLMRPLGEFSPMGLAWTFLGFSKGYNIFMGIVEILAVLLLFRRTMVLGACITLATSVNIMTINYFYDVPVKMISTALFLLSLFLLLPYMKTFVALFLQGKYGQLPVPRKPKMDKIWKERGVLIFKIAILAIFGIQQVVGLSTRQKMIDHYMKKSPLYGIYQIDNDIQKRATIPNDWSFLIFENDGRVTIRDRYYQAKYEEAKIDTDEKTVSLNHFTLDYEIMPSGDIILKKVWDGKMELVKLTKLHSEELELMKRGFNWIQEYPYNR